MTEKNPFVFAHSGNEVEQAQPGMTLRDYFAGQVVAGWGESFHALAYDVNDRFPDADTIAATAYAVAEAMLKARARWTAQ